MQIAPRVCTLVLFILPVNISVCTSSVHRIDLCNCLHYNNHNIRMLNEQVAYKRGVAGPKKMAAGINYCQNGRLAKAKVTLVFWTQALSHN